MAKAKTTKAAAPAENTAETKTPKAPAVERGANDRFVRVMKNGDPAPATNPLDGTAKRVAPQMQVIADTLAEYGDEGVTRKDLVAKLEADAKLKTKQPVGRILSYYQKDLVKFGLATRTESAAESAPAAK